MEIIEKVILILLTFGQKSTPNMNLLNHLVIIQFFDTWQKKFKMPWVQARQINGLWIR